MTSLTSSRRGRAWFAGLVLVSLAIALLAAAGCASQAPNEIVIRDLRFNPKVLTVSPGTTVKWLNEDQTAHTVTSDSFGSTSTPAAQQFSSMPLSPGDSYTFTFTTAGTYKYHCEIHPYLMGEVVVR